MKKKVWIFNHYATDTMLDHGGRHYWFAKYLTRAGYDVRIFCASTVHDTDINFDVGESGYCEKMVDGLKYTLIQTSNYVGNGKSRVKATSYLPSVPGTWSISTPTAIAPCFSANFISSIILS